MTQTHVDVAVVGGGMVGAAVALGLAKQGKQVAIIEGYQPRAYDPSQAHDIRISAISKTSIDLLQRLGAWPHIQSKRVYPYTGLETWELDNCHTKFDAASLDLPLLGYMVENRILQLGIWQAIEPLSNVTFYCPDSLVSIKDHNQGKLIELSSGKTITANLVVGADGANSQVRQSAGIGVTAWDYRQDCMLINVETDCEDIDVTWQRFSASGPRSYLPIGEGFACLVWYDSPSRIKQLSQLSPAELKNEIEAFFPSRVGKVTVNDFASFPLKRRHAQHYCKEGIVLVGDSAHTINPLAGQGVNLGFKDVSALLEVLVDGDYSLENLLQYQKARKTDNLMMQTAMDAFYLGFSNDIAPIKMLRNIGLKLADRAGPLKHQALRYALGL
ncbi:2-octaprenyl-3-methyl-6-methoxy-1,4-benzoquinol hydroxylase [Vibrio sp. UCD-FRSSP16_10]|uniref:FAD-dependent oxidoreductase n=1 Tax=unclassified Vibrio TaxID=2614977 RepID=UPI0008006351|nr:MULTISPECIES: FAD-dependent oxidoreductase [unclassified Vibrio]OBT12875.1 2-octaprenyl-3-methyl-6-methoxy-1,4-benzoquinol hydroxylase [Vibrio sp. UCD-FRSSP16_30]OBT18211.1 2-octaprenyl-3-methyl-6-methoxy-1,4-benzoquinol hydroxylase [Vibrio sp. UCD-FRSSP16_10]